MKEIMRGRRHVLALAATMPIVGACAGKASAKNGTQSSTFVLVPGAWAGGWYYRRVANLLQQQGHQVFTPGLTGVGEKSHLLSLNAGLKTHTDDVVNLVRWEDLRDIVLVGHSYGGMVITGAAEVLESRIKSIVYLDAFIPDAGQSMLDVVGAASRARIEAQAQRTHGLWLDPIPARVLKVNEADQRWVDEKMTPHPFASFRDPIASASAYQRIRRKVYVRATRFASQPFDETMSKLRSRGGWDVQSLDAGHNLMIDRPADVADILLKAAG